MLVDTHAHLDMPHFDADRDAVMERAAEAGVMRIVTIGSDMPSSRAAMALAERYPGVYATVGLHPNSAAEWEPTTLDELRELAANHHVVAIGEIGLDFYWDAAPRDVQVQVFQAQLDLAAEMGLPIVIHMRSKNEPGHDAHTTTWDILAAWAARHPWQGRRPLGVLHCFSGDAALADAALAAGFHLGLDGPLTYKSSRALQAMAAAWPVSQVVVETDAPYLTPHLHRGERNEPAYVRFVAEKLAELRGVPLEQVAEETTAAAESLFRL